MQVQDQEKEGSIKHRRLIQGFHVKGGPKIFKEQRRDCSQRSILEATESQTHQGRHSNLSISRMHSLTKKSVPLNSRVARPRSWLRLNQFWCSLNAPIIFSLPNLKHLSKSAHK